MRIERAFSKEYIMELYLNQIYLGHYSYGVAAAALNYFNKALDELTVAESAFLAALPKGPNNYDPDKRYDEAVARSRAGVQNFIPAFRVDSRRQQNGVARRPIAVDGLTQFNQAAQKIVRRAVHVFPLDEKRRPKHRTPFLFPFYSGAFSRFKTLVINQFFQRLP